MTINEIIEELERTKDYPASDPASDEALDGAIDIMRKYQKIEQILKKPCIIPEGCYPMLREIETVIEADSREEEDARNSN